MATTADTLETRLSQKIGDYIQESTTTNITTNNNIVSTNFNKWDGGEDNHFINWWAIINGTNNAWVERQISDYTTSSGTVVVRGAALAAESAAVAVRLYKYSRTDKLRALNDAIREISQTLFRRLDDITLITGNILPNAHFEDWASASYPDKYGVTNATAAKATTAGLIRGGLASALVTASAADGYMYITSKDYPRLLDLMDKTIDFKCWAYPSVADDAFLTIYTIQADGTTQTLNSTTTCPASKHTLLELEDQEISDDIVEIQFRFRVHTNAATCYFDDARVNGRYLYEYLLPTNFQNGVLNQVQIQASGYSDDACDDLFPKYWSEPQEFRISYDGTDKYVRLNALYTSLRRIRLTGNCPLESLSASTDTISLDDPKVNLLVTYAAMKLYERVRGTVSSEDKSLINEEIARLEREYRLLKVTLGMMPSPSTLFTGK